MKTLPKTIILALVGLLPTHAFAEWREETYTLNAGWNAIYTFVDASHATIDQYVVGSPDIEEIWRWQPERLDPRLIDVSEPSPTGVEWAVWKRDSPEDTTFDRIHANFGYLVKLRDGASQQTFTITGRAELPEVRWRTDRLHLVGFPVNEAGSTPRFSDYLSESGLSIGQSAILRYVGGPIQNGVNPRAINNNVTRIDRGRGYWVDLGEFSRFYGPLRVQLDLGNSIDFGRERQTARVILTNFTESPMDVAVSLENSETPPPGQSAIVGGVPLNTRYEDETENVLLGSGRTLTIPGGGKTQLILVLDRQAMTANSGDLFASVLKFAIPEEEVFLSVSAEQASSAGLWVGEISVNQVGSIVKRYRRDAEGNTIFDSVSGAPEVIEDMTTPQAATELPAVLRPYPLKVILHVDTAGSAKLLSHVYSGILLGSELTDPVGLTTDESILDPEYLSGAVRLSVAHLPQDTELALSSSGKFGPGQNMAGVIAVNFDEAGNPFVHQFHPDHDNLDARFTNGLSAGQESFNIVRNLSFEIDTAAPAGSPPGWGTTYLTGTFTEDIDGVFKDTLRTRGVFSVKKVSDVDTLSVSPGGQQGPGGGLN
ncbi:MAG: hypothetical protein AAGA58_17500 [Verrucomicrobiota bacterium]